WVIRTNCGRRGSWPAMRGTWTSGGARVPLQAGSGHGVQDTQRAGSEAAQGALLFGTPRPRIQREDGGGSVHLPRGQDYQGDRGHFEEEAERCGGGHFL